MNTNHRFESVKRIFPLTVALLFLLSSAFSVGGAAAQTPPWIQSDQPDYNPAQIVTLSGGAWLPGEMVQLLVNDDAGQTWNLSDTVQADDTGAFTYQFQLPDSFVAIYSVTATGQASGAVATTTFTDAVGSISPTSGPEGQSFTLTLARSGSPVWTSNTKIVFAGQTLATTFIDNAHISAVVPASLVADEGTKTVSITSPTATAPSFTVTEGDVFTLTPQAVAATTNSAFSGKVATLADTYDNTATARSRRRLTGVTAAPSAGRLREPEMAPMMSPAHTHGRPSSGQPR